MGPALLRESLPSSLGVGVQGHPSCSPGVRAHVDSAKAGLGRRHCLRVPGQPGLLGGCWPRVRHMDSGFLTQGLGCLGARIAPAGLCGRPACQGFSCLLLAVGWLDALNACLFLRVPAMGLGAGRLRVLHSESLDPGVPLSLGSDLGSGLCW